MPDENKVSDRVASQVDKRAEDLKEAARQVEARWDNTKEKAMETGRRMKDYAEEHPWQATAIAGVAGLIVGLLLGGKKRD